MDKQLTEHKRIIPHLPCHVPMYCIGNPIADKTEDVTTVYYHRDNAINHANNQDVNSILLCKGAPVTLKVFTEDDIGSKEEIEIETARIVDCKGFFIYK